MAAVDGRHVPAVAQSVLGYLLRIPLTKYRARAGSGGAPELLQQGFLYLLDSVANDPFTPMVTLAAVLTPLVFAGTHPVSLGIVLTSRTVWVAATLSGRFFAAPFLCAVVLPPGSRSPRDSADRRWRQPPADRTEQHPTDHFSTRRW